ncbi:MAG: arsenate reductase (glutaredoxin) [Thalassovita sp.]|nr:arsenate reductase (glutaredoxin) [Thalassovita sp.]
MITIWHNPRCSKSRQTLALIEDRDVTIRKYLEDAPTVEEIRAARDALGMGAIEMMRVKEKVFKELGLSRTDDDEILIAAMAENPVLIERPIVFANGKAAIGRPPEAVLEIL